MSLIRLLGALACLSLLQGCLEAFENTDIRTSYPSTAFVEGDILPLQYLRQTYADFIVAEGKDLLAEDKSGDLERIVIRPEDSSQGKTVLFCYDLDDGSSSAFPGFRLGLGEKRTFLYADTERGFAQYRGDTTLTTHSFFTKTGICGSATSDLTSTFKSMSVYPAISSRRSYPSRSPKAKGQVKVSEFVIVVLP